METVLQDLQYGVRILLKRPGFSVVAILTLASGIGVSTALVSVIDAALLRPLPYPHPEELVGVLVRETSTGSRAGTPLRWRTSAPGENPGASSLM